MKRGFDKKGQIWVETVIYTLIALILIGAVVSIVKPKIDAGRDQAIIEQSVNLMKSLDSIFTEIKQASGNQRIIELGIKKGNFIFDGKGDKIIFEIESTYEYSESGKDIEEGASGIMIHTQKIGKVYNVTLTKDYSTKYNLTYFDKDSYKIISASPTSYKATLLNRGQYKFIDDLSTCSSSDDLNLVCINPLYQIGFTKSCYGGKCRYTQEVFTINIDIT